jgi:probable F420-dependent oxidoreductase
MRAFQFGLGISPFATPEADPVRDAKRAEELGFDFLSTSDHPEGGDPMWECWTMITYVAAATSRIQIATRVLGVPYRPPAMVAKMAATLDRLAGGRLILGLGGGASDKEFRAFGLPVPSPRDKVDGLAEAIRITRGLWSQPRFTFHGRLFRTDAADLEPKPDRHIPIWLGTYGKRALDLTGRLADGWIPSLGYAGPEAIPALRDQITAAAERAGRDPGEVTAVYNVPVRIDGDPTPGVVTGPPGAVAEQLAGFAGLGFTAFNFMPYGPDPSAQTERLAIEVIPALR